jgi:hypothetical protein
MSSTRVTFISKLGKDNNIDHLKISNDLGKTIYMEIILLDDDVLLLYAVDDEEKRKVSYEKVNTIINEYHSLDDSDKPNFEFDNFCPYMAHIYSKEESEKLKHNNEYDIDPNNELQVYEMESDEKTCWQFIIFDNMTKNSFNKLSHGVSIFDTEKFKDNVIPKVLWYYGKGGNHPLYYFDN